MDRNPLIPFFERHFFSPILQAENGRYSFRERCMLRMIQTYIAHERRQFLKKNEADILAYLDDRLTSLHGANIDQILRTLRLPTLSTVAGYMLFLGKYYNQFPPHSYLFYSDSVDTKKSG